MTLVFHLQAFCFVSTAINKLVSRSSSVLWLTPRNHEYVTVQGYMCMCLSVVWLHTYQGFQHQRMFALPVPIKFPFANKSLNILEAVTAWSLIREGVCIFALWVCGRKTPSMPLCVRWWVFNPGLMEGWMVEEERGRRGGSRSFSVS